jgi:hypothetical protein
LQIQFNQLLDTFESLVREAEQGVELSFLCSGDLFGGQQGHITLLKIDPISAGRGFLAAAGIPATG